jgi:quinoprotein glucose dehydrogenase
MHGREAKGHPAWKWLYLLFASVLGLLGLAMAGLGAYLLVLGGTAYYIVAGLFLLSGGLLAWFGRHRSAMIACGAAILLTLAWSLFEIAGKGWLPAWGFDFAARMGIVSGLVIGAAASFVFWQTPRHSFARIGVSFGIVAAFAAAGLVIAMNWERVEAPESRAEQRQAPATESQARDASAEWTAYGGTTAGRRYSTLAQVHTGNVGELEEAWTFRSGDLTPAEGRVFYSSQNTPIKAGDFLYTCTSSSRVYALDPATGEVKWHYDPQVPPRSMESLFSAACRAVAYFDDGEPAGQPTQSAKRRRYRA